MDNIAKLETAVPIIEQLNAHGHSAYIVGGAVRNYLLDIPINDVDITTSATPDEIEAVFERTVPVGKEHGTIMVLDTGEPFEVTTYRIDGTYEDFRRPDEVIFVTELKDDLLRRDFTINAMALDSALHVVDYADGQHDLNHRLIRAVGNPYDRFHEDALRMIRACRFQSTLDFRLEDETARAMKTHAQLISHVAIERIIVEFRKLLQGLNPEAALMTVEAAGIHAAIPVLQQLEPLMKPRHAVTLEAYFGYCLYKGQFVERGLAQLKLSNQEKKAIKASCEIYRELDAGAAMLLVYKYGAALVINCLDMRAALGIPAVLTAAAVRQLHSALPIEDRSEMAVDGHLLMTHLGRKGGSWLKGLLGRVEEHIVLGRLPNNKEAILKWVDDNV
ncbi:CCA tRNA nucleotidyltransferase [Macrococcus equipercicus]|nr:CCA tRNA nucleotidyltransferase [Macrococcus equipercicus]UTH12854.1 CCA tRNA nucleotidyltransferase [Macrococcus equipercicus]